jgi:ribosomal protein S18 acetylase RimI-like enzyme
LPDVPTTRPRKSGWQILREHGAVHYLQRALRQRGIHSFRFYWIREPVAPAVGVTASQLPDGLTMRELGPDDLPALLGFPARGAPMTADHITEAVTRGDLCVGILRGPVLLACSFASVGQSHTRVFSRPLAGNEGYIHNTYVVPEERGKGFAVLLNLFQLEVLAQRGYPAVYSIVAAANAPALRAKDKIGAQREVLGWHLNLRDRLVGSMVLRRLA